MTMKGKGRKKGDWVAVARGRGNKERDYAKRPATGGMNYPKLGDVGSAAYRRLLSRVGRKR